MRWRIHAPVWAMLRAEIAAAGGWLPLHDMDRALYAPPGLGYYAAGAEVRVAGDFVTAPEISPLFGRCLARAAGHGARCQGDVLELGPGSGKLARDVLVELDTCNALPNRYLMLEVSADLRERQRALCVDCQVTCLTVLSGATRCRRIFAARCWPMKCWT